MTIKVIITLDKEDIDDYCEGYREVNYELPTKEQILADFEETFYADCAEYIFDIAEVEMRIEED